MGVRHSVQPAGLAFVMEMLVPGTELREKDGCRSEVLLQGGAEGSLWLYLCLQHRAWGRAPAQLSGATVGALRLSAGSSGAIFRCTLGRKLLEDLERDNE